MERGLNKIYSIAIQKLRETEFTSSEGQTLRYMLFPEKESKVLLAGFQACNDNGARYNYVKTVSQCRINRVFIKDDFGINSLSHLGGDRNEICGIKKKEAGQQSYYLY